MWSKDIDLNATEDGQRFARITAYPDVNRIHVQFGTKREEGEHLEMLTPSLTANMAGDLAHALEEAIRQLA